MGFFIAFFYILCHNIGTNKKGCPVMTLGSNKIFIICIVVALLSASVVIYFHFQLQSLPLSNMEICSVNSDINMDIEIKFNTAFWSLYFHDYGVLIKNQIVFTLEQEEISKDKLQFKSRLKQIVNNYLNSERLKNKGIKAKEIVFKKVIIDSSATLCD